MVPGFLPVTQGAHAAPDADRLALLWLQDQSVPARWDMGAADLSVLLGVDEQVFNAWLDELAGTGSLSLGADVRERIGYLFRLDCILSIVIPAQDRWQAFRLPTTGTSFFHGLSIRDYLLAEPVPARFLAACNYLQGHVILGRPLDLRRLR